MTLRAKSVAAFAFACLLGAMPIAAADGNFREEPWSLGCPRNGLSSVAVVAGRPDFLFTRTYRGQAANDPNVCVVEMNGRVLHMVRQVMRQGSSLSDAMQGSLSTLFPARPGQEVSTTAFLRVEGVSPPVEQQYTNSYRYVGQLVMSVDGKDRRAALLVHREEGLTNNYAAESHYYFDTVSHELLRFEYRAERGQPRAIASWRVRGISQ